MANERSTSAEFLVNPDLNPKSFALTGTSTADSTTFYFADACGLAAAFGLISGGADGVAMLPSNGLTAGALKAYLQTYALIIKEYRFLAEDENDLTNNLEAIHIGLDKRNENEVLTSNDATTPFANNPNLLVVPRPFVWTASTALKITANDNVNHDYTFTFTVKKMVPYGALDQWLKENPIPKVD